MGISFFKKNDNIDFEKIRMKYLKKQGKDISHGYSIIKSSKNLSQNTYMMKLADQYDKYGYMPQELGEELDNLFMDDNYVIGIHRTGYTGITNEVLDNIFNKGLINNGHVFSGANTGQCDIEKTVTLFNDFSILCWQLKVSHGYKGSEGCVIVRIPKECLYETNKNPMPMYYVDQGINRLLPQYVYGYVPVDKEGKLGNIHHNSNYSTKTIDNENLLFDDRVFYRFKRNGKELKRQKKTNNEKYEIIKKAYIETLNKYGAYQAENALLQLINNNSVKYFTGDENRKQLENHVIFSDVLNVLSRGSINKIESNSLNIDMVIKSFQDDVIKENNQKIR